MRIALIYNPTAGGVQRAERLERLIAELERLGHTIARYNTVIAGHATALAHQAVEQEADTIVGVGGDGTLNEIIQGIIGTTVPLAVYPLGTTNVWARQIEMPVDPVQAAQIISSGPRRQVDLGRLNNRYFLLMAGLGLDGAVVNGVDTQLKKRVGKLAYGLAALRLLFKFKNIGVKIILEPNSLQPQHFEIATSLLIVTNVERYATVKVAPEARADDGQLELLVLEDTGLGSRLRGAWNFVNSRTEHDQGVRRYQASQFEIQTNRSTLLQMDGDAAGETSGKPFQIECVPLALHVVVPTNAPPHLFSRF